jgi:hypothetical protein
MRVFIAVIAGPAGAAGATLGRSRQALGRLQETSWGREGGREVRAVRV